MITRLFACRWLFVCLASMAAIAGVAVIRPDVVLDGFAALGSHSVEYGVAYGAGPQRTLDAYRPTAVRDGAPIVVFVHGGRWNSGAKEDYRFLGAALASRGFITVIVDYRLYPQVRFPAFLQDVALAFRWTVDNAQRLGGDSRRIFLMGHSAGAHIAAMLAFNRQWLAETGLSPENNVAGVIGLSGPYSFSLNTDLLRGVFGSASSEAETQPINFVDGCEPPVFLATDPDDKVVRPANTYDLAARIRAAGGDVIVAAYRHLGHAGTISAFSPLLRFRAPIFEDTAAFISRAPRAASRSPP